LLADKSFVCFLTIECKRPNSFIFGQPTFHTGSTKLLACSSSFHHVIRLLDSSLSGKSEEIGLDCYGAHIGVLYHLLVILDHMVNQDFFLLPYFEAIF
jgi:hypothetical protein